MAKKITITGSELSDFAFHDDWGGQNSTTEAQTIHGTNVPAGAEWGMNRGEVERVVKAKASEIEQTLGVKVGGLAISREIDSNNYYHILGFSTIEQAQAYKMSGETEGQLFDIELPISTVQADTYRAVLTTSRVGSTSARPFILQRGDEWNVPIRLNAWHIFAADNTRTLLPATTTLIVEKSANGTEWTRVRTATISSTESESTFPLSVDIGSYIDSGVDEAMQIRFRIEPFPYDDNGVTAYLSASPVIIYVRTVNLSLSMPDSQWQQAKIVASGVQNLNGLVFTLLGNVPKTLHLQVTNSRAIVTYDNTFNNITAVGPYEVNATDNSGTMGLTDSGVHEVTAWLTCQSIDGTTLTSEVIRHQIVVVNEGNMAGAMTRQVLLQHIAASVDNFVQSEVCRYMVWNPKLQDGEVYNDASEQVQVRFIVADASDLAEEHAEYLSLPVTVTPGTAYPLRATMEVEDDTTSAEFAAYLHALSLDGDSMLLQPQFLTIDNTAGFQPVGGSVFHLNPKARDNGETNPQTIINARNAATSPDSTWTGFKMDDSDGYTIDENGEKVLRVPAGRLLTILYNPFNWFYTSPGVSKAMTLDIDFCVRNVTNEEDPVVRLAEYQESIGAYLGLMMKPMDGTMIGVTSGTNIQETDFRWAEGRRQHLSIAIIPGVRPNQWEDLQYNTVRNTKEQSVGTIDLVRVTLNGVVIRETRFTPGRAAEFCTGAMSNGGIIIGQVGTDGRSSGADIDIYGIREWHTGMTPQQQVQNWVSTIPSGDDKRRIKKQNAILRDDNSGRISLAKVKESGKNALIWHGDMPLIDDDKKKGWMEAFVYDNDGNYLPEYSGTFCKATKKLSAKGQGTTAMTYYYWNMQVKLGDVTDTITLEPSQIHPGIVLGTPSEGESGWTVPIYGGCLGKDYPVGNKTKDYPCTVDGSGNLLTVTVPDGWVDGNGLYRGMCWQNGPSRPLAQKLVLKINYASSMQSHLIGVNWLFNELHTRYCGENSLQAGTPSEYKAQVAKQVTPMLFFTAGVDATDTQTTESTATYQGPGGFGPGKMDKPTWGYSSKYSGHADFAMFEGAVNNSVLSDFLAPWDDEPHTLANGTVQPAKVRYFLHDPVSSANKDPEAFFYRRTSLVTRDITDDQGNITGQETVEVDNWEKGIGFDAGAKNGDDTFNDGESPAENITAILRRASNYVYLHNPNINLYRGTFADFQQRIFSETELKQKWVCRANSNDADNYLVKRYDFCERRWVDAGLWNPTNRCYDPIDIRYVDGMNWSSMSSAEKNDHAAVLAKYKQLLTAEAYPTTTNAGIGAYFKVSSLRFHYAFVNLFIAGTDNCSKNTYYVIDPATKLIELHQDDVDTVLATDNYGYQTKPYYIDRKHPYPDGSTVSGYDGMNNGLFDLVEAMWLDDSNHTIQNTLGEVLNLMAQLTGGLPSAESEMMGGVWRALNRYLFNIQRWIPQVAYNEAARIRYEFPAMLGYTGRDGQARPLAQSCGDQLEAEIQFMKRRLVYMASYAGCCEFSPSIASGRQSTGIDDLGTIFSIPVTALPNGDIPTYTFRLVPHQYLYPSFYQQGDMKPTHHRTAPGEEYEFTVPNLSVNDYAVVLPGLNYYRSIGNVGNMSTPSNYSLELAGQRLTSFVAEPTLYYPTAGGTPITAAAYDALSDKSGYLPAFRPQTASLPRTYAATRLQNLSTNGCSTLSSSAAIPLDLSSMTLLQTLDLRTTNLQAVILPQISTLTSVQLPANLTSLRVRDLPALQTLTMQGYGNLTELVVTGCPLVGEATKSIIVGARETGQRATMLILHEIDWISAVSLSDLRWMLAAGTCDLQGAFSVDGTPGIDDMTLLITRFGNIRDANNPLYVTYTAATIPTVTISGRKYVKDSMLVERDGEKWWDELTALIRSGNNIAVHTKADGTTVPDIKWSLLTVQNGEITTTPYTGQQAAFPDVYINAMRIRGTAAQRSNVLVGVKVEVTTENFRTQGGVTIYTGEQTVLSAQRVIGLWDRVPKVGDFAWTDGEFDDVNDESKYLAGIVVKTDDTLDSNGDLIERECWVVACGGNNAAAANAHMPATKDGSIGAADNPQWGPYNSSDDGFTSTDALIEQIVNGVEEDGEIIVPGTKDWTPPEGILNGDYSTSFRTDFFDTPLKNNTNALTIPVPSDITDAYRDAESAEGIESGGYKQTFSSSGVRDVVMNFETRKENAILMSYADATLKAAFRALVGYEVQIPRTPDEMAEVLKTMYFCPNNTYIEDGEEKHVYTLPRLRQLLFGAARSCNVWSPQDVYDPNGTGVDIGLCEEYGRGKWMLPSSGLAARILCFWQNSKLTTTVDPDKEPYNGLSLEAFQPIFSYAVKKGRPIYFSGSSYHWCSSEYNRAYGRYVSLSSGYMSYGTRYYTGTVSRPVAAFIFRP